MSRNSVVFWIGAALFLAAVVLMTNSNTGRALYRSLFADLMQSLFEISVPPLRLDEQPGAAAGCDCSKRS